MQHPLSMGRHPNLCFHHESPFVTTLGPKLTFDWLACDPRYQCTKQCTIDEVLFQHEEAVAYDVSTYEGVQQSLE